MGIDVLYHVRGAAPIKGANTLRFRNKFQGYSCLFASPREAQAVADWFSRYVTGSYSYISALRWNDAGQLIGITINDMSKSAQFEIDRAKIMQTMLYVYTFNLDDKWNKHPTKDCYMTRSNVRYNRDVKMISLYNLIAANLTIEFTE